MKKRNIRKAVEIIEEVAAGAVGAYVMITGGQEYITGIKNRNYRQMASGAMTFVTGRFLKEMACEVVSTEITEIILARKGGDIRVEEIK